MQRTFFGIAIFLMCALLFGGFTHAFIEHSHASELAADLLHAPISGDSRYLFLILAASFLMLEFLLALPHLVPATPRNEELLASLFRRERTLRRSVRSVYE